MSSQRLVPVLLAALLAGCGPAGDLHPELPWGQRLDGIVGGVVDNGDPAVVSLSIYHQGEYYSYCTATLVAPETLVTAAHCTDVGAPSWAVFGTQVDAPDDVVRVVQQIPHPDYSTQTQTSDIAVLQLISPVVGIPPIPVNATPLGQGVVGLPIRHVGYGQVGPSAGGSGTKREVTYTLRDVRTLKLESGDSGKQTCFGDSGGPGLMVVPGDTAESLVGVVSYGDQYCAQYGVDTRVDPFAAWVQQTMAPWEAPTCEDDGKCLAGCAPIDVDCACQANDTCDPACPDLTRDPDCPKDCVQNGVCATDACPWPDPDCREEGESCATDLSCVERTCVGDPQHASLYCSRACAQDADCPLPDTECEAGACRFIQKAPVAPGDPCDDGSYCLAGTVCTAAQGEDRRCHFPCSGTGAQCPDDDQTCEQSAEGVYYCALPPPQPEPPVVNEDPLPDPAPAQVNPEPPAAGCSAAASAGAPLWAGLLLFAGLFANRRRVRAARGAAVCAAALALACGPTTTEVDRDGPLQRGQLEIVGGSVDNGDPEVFMLVAQYSDGTSSICSSTLIARRTLATAAHCVDASLSQSGGTLQDIYAMNKVSLSQANQSDFFVAVERQIHPGWDPQGSLDDDIALLLLDRAPPVTPKPWNQASLAGFSGRPIRAVGYGITSKQGNDSGVKRQVSLVIDQLDSDHLYMGNGVNQGVCHGDSGGPTFHTFGDGVERLVGIHSYDANGNCTYGADIRIDAYDTFVNAWLNDKEGPQCSQDGLCRAGCNPFDVDCYCVANGTCDPQCPDLRDDPDCDPDCVQNFICSTQACPTPDVDCVAEGDPCSSEVVCRNRVCISDPQHPDFYCSRPCTQSNECPAGMECVPGANVCRYLQLPEVQPGAECTVGASYCIPNSICTALPGEQPHCYSPCTSDADCGGDACELGVGGVMFCNSPPDQPEEPEEQAPPVIIPRASIERQALATSCAAAGGAPVGLVLLALGGAVGRRRRRAHM